MTVSTEGANESVEEVVIVAETLSEDDDEAEIEIGDVLELLTVDETVMVTVIVAVTGDVAVTEIVPEDDKETELDNETDEDGVREAEIEIDPDAELLTVGVSEIEAKDVREGDEVRVPSQKSMRLNFV